MDLYLYSAFLVLMTTQSSLQYSFTFTQLHTHSYSASISSTLLFYEGQFGVQHLAQGHFGMQTSMFRSETGSCCYFSVYYPICIILHMFDKSQALNTSTCQFFVIAAPTGTRNYMFYTLVYLPKAPKVDV